MSNFDTMSSTPSEILPAAQPEGNLPQVATGVMPALAVATTTPNAPTAIEVVRLDNNARNTLGNDWAVLCREAGVEANKQGDRSDAALRHAIATLALSVVFFPETDWAAKVDALRIGSANIRSKHKFAMAVVGAFGLNPYDKKDATKAKRDGQALGFYTLATEWMANFIDNMSDGELAVLTLDAAGVVKLGNVLLNAGGMRAVSDLQRAANKEAVVASRLRVSIDKKGATEIVAARGERRLRNRDGLTGNMPVLVLIDVKVGGAQASYTLTDKLLATIKEYIFTSEAGVDPIVDTLGELMKVSAVVPHEVADATNAAPIADPEMFVGSRQFVLRTDRSVLVSPVASGPVSGPIVVARPVIPLIETLPTNLCRLSSKGWQFAEANLIDTDRRQYFGATIRAATNASGVASIELATSVTGSDDTFSRGIDIKPIASGLADYPIEFDTSSFQPDFVFDVLVTSLDTWCENVASKLRDDKSCLKLIADGTNAKLQIGKHDLGVNLTGCATAGEVYLHKVDVIAMRKMLAGLDGVVDPMISFEVDPKAGMRVGFSTKLATYEFYAPVLQPGSFKPYAQSFRPIAVA